MESHVRSAFRSLVCSSLALVFLALCPVSCGREPESQASNNPSSPSTQPDAAPATQPAAAAATGQPSGAQPAAAPSTAIHFKRYSITDTQGFQGMEVLHGVMPVDWNVTGGVTWRMDLGPPQHIRLHWGDAQDICAFDLYPFIGFAWGNQNNPNARRFQPGQVSLGSIIEPPPDDQFDAIDKVIVQNFRPDLKDAQVIKKDKNPEAAKAIYQQLSTDPANYALYVAVGREVFEYQLKGQTVQESVSGVLTITTSLRYGFKMWSLSQATSERAPKGAFDQLTPINSIMFQSLQMNPAWVQNVANLIQQRQGHTAALQQQQREQQQTQFNAIESRIASQTAANDAEHQAYWAHSADLNRQSENEADVQREVSPWKDSDGNTYKLPNEYGHAWSGANGEIIMNNDAGYNPNSDPNAGSTSWTEMQPTQN
jgi:hypothetical protein